MNTFILIGITVVVCIITMLLIVKFSPIFKNMGTLATSDCDGMCDHCPEDLKILCQEHKITN